MKRKIFQTEKGEGLEKRLNEIKVREFQEIYNPMKMFHKLRRIGIETKEALNISQHYESLFYSALVKFYFKKDKVAEVQRETLSYFKSFG